MILLEKDKGRSIVLRLAHPGCETQFLSTDSASEAQAWCNKINALCYGPHAETQEDARSYEKVSSKSDGSWAVCCALA